ncbi:ABC transporter ATP-binding protein [Pseudorhodoplanes sinuspersici]|uniref:Spermidine/putrescine import ATP-binding protein PotA n=1 Tax=Pseudorhodoplanes sinuspersici TaxID=1235591 RepID=A0A1W6ZM06_9HYPH|nr:ABC transporter ATP-binding protein [Pseudorhodoplanes sinuspersici]ARP98315.1 polyamine ABC transporter ATP-binding protein [Pseudorhodoplanes sinuspersici]RKE65971.1 putrescine transport system ATP-binding protein [Pseudorhodoplanes sinuspersici]
MPDDPAGKSGRSPSSPVVRFDAVTRRFGAFTAVDHVSLDIGRGEFFALLGPSGCGKTTLLRMLAGFEQPDEGHILLDGVDVVGMPPYERPVNMMFQSYALFPHLTVAGNVAFGLRQEGWNRSDIDARVKEMLALVKLSDFAHRKPHQLSGGQRQRVALARALAKSPKVFLLDEPLAALDKKLRDETQFELMALQQRLGLSFIIVTHDQEEAMTMADRIGVMHAGKLVQVGTPAEIYEEPRTRWVAEFIGDINLFDGKVADYGGGLATVDTASGSFDVVSKDYVQAGDNVCVAVRPEKVAIHRAEPSEKENVLHGQIADIGYLGDLSVYKMRLDNGMLIKASVANTDRHAATMLHRGDAAWLSFAPDAGVLIRS